MFPSPSLTEFADKYSDHIVFATSAGSGPALAGIWHLIPVELAMLFSAAVFIAARVCVERLWHQHHARKAARKRQRPGVPARKHRVHA